MIIHVGRLANEPPFDAGPLFGCRVARSHSAPVPHDSSAERKQAPAPGSYVTNKRQLLVPLLQMIISIIRHDRAELQIKIPIRIENKLRFDEPALRVGQQRAPANRDLATLRSSSMLGARRLDGGADKLAACCFFIIRLQIVCLFLAGADDTHTHTLTRRDCPSPLGSSARTTRRKWHTVRRVICMPVVQLQLQPMPNGSGRNGS